MNKMLIISFMVLLFGCSSGKDETAGSSTVVPNPTIIKANDEKKKINNMNYSSSMLSLRNQIEILNPYYPTYFGSKATTFTVFPSLPQGLHISSLSGRIAGTPEEIVYPARAYFITASNEYGSHTIQLFIQIIDQSPFGLRYNVDHINLIKNVSEIGFLPESNLGVRGGAKIRSYSISPNLPVGLTFDTLTGSIDGIATTSFGLTNYTITGINNGGSVQTQISLVSKSSMSSIVAGGKHTCAIIDNEVQCWGDNKYGQLGVNPSLKATSTTGNLVPHNFSTIRKITAGSENTCVTQTDSKLYCFGKNQNNQLGIDATQSLYYSPTFITDLIIDGSLSKHGYEKNNSYAHGCSTTNGGYGYCFGLFPFGDLSLINYEIRSSSNVAIPYISLISSGSNFTCFISFQKLYCIGDNSFGQLGDNQVSGSSGSAFGVTPIGMESGISSIAAGSNFACAIKNGKVYCWGDNSQGQLGDSSYLASSSYFPIEVKGLPIDKAISNISAGSNHVCILAESQVYCWGDNTFGQIGNKGIGTKVLAPTQVLKEDNTLFEAITMITAGEDHNCLLSSNDAYYCWGRNDKGQLGTQNNINYNYPKKVILSN